MEMERIGRAEVLNVGYLWEPSGKVCALCKISRMDRACTAALEPRVDAARIFERS